MTQRPVFLPTIQGQQLWIEQPVDFDWKKGQTREDKQENVRRLKAGAQRLGLHPILEASTRSDTWLGIRLSAFNLCLPYTNRNVPVECIYQGSKIFELGGPYTDLYTATPLEAKQDPRLRESGAIVGFHFQQKDWPVDPFHAFYHWIYIHALLRTTLYPRIMQHQGFTDIAYNPATTVNCQARALALYRSLMSRHIINIIHSSTHWISMHQRLEVLIKDGKQESLF